MVMLNPHYLAYLWFLIFLGPFDVPDVHVSNISVKAICFSSILLDTDILFWHAGFLDRTFYLAIYRHAIYFSVFNVPDLPGTSCYTIVFNLMRLMQCKNISAYFWRIYSWRRYAVLFETGDKKKKLKACTDDFTASFFMLCLPIKTIFLRCETIQRLH